MLDSFGRSINYLRISLTDRCNLRCQYCMPEKGLKNKVTHKDILTIEEVYHLIKEFVDLGIDKIRFTGGEPLIRKGIIDLIEKVNTLEGVKDLTITTNGLLLKDMAKSLKKAGIHRVNISLDTLNKDKYSEITRGGDLSRVLEGIEEGIRVGLTPIKINTVLIGGFNENEIEDLVNLTRRGIDVRFIELMPIGEAMYFAKDKFVSNSRVLETIRDLVPVEREDKSSPAVYYKLPDAKGRVGIINPVSCKFCDNCNRVRLTSTGKLKTCLHSNKEIDLKVAIRKQENIKEIIKKGILSKEESHHLEEGKYTYRNMNQIGG